MSQDEPRRRLIRPGELLAIRSDVVQEDRGAFFWLFAPRSYRNERVGAANDIAVVRVNGPLDYHDDGWGESYESIVCRVGDAMTGQDVVSHERMMHRWEEGWEEPEPVPPRCVIMRIDSPGGVVAGLDQTVTKLRSMAKDSGVPLYAYVDETAYSAGFALCCACSQIVLPKSGFLGSIGVISTMVDQTAADRKAGYRFVVLTSGARKADGHPHVPISDAMQDEERPRVATLAKQFFGVVKRARGIDAKTIQGWEAKRFLGAEAKAAGLADSVDSWDGFVAALSQSEPKPLARLGTRVPSSTSATSSLETRSMNISVDALIARTEKAIKSEKDPLKIAALGAELESYKKTKHSIEKHETEEGDDEEEEEEESASGDETDREDEEEGDDEEEDEDDEDEDEKKSASKKSFAHDVVKAAGLPDKPARKALRAAVLKALDAYEASTGASKVYEAACKMTGKKNATAIIAALEGKVSAADGLKDRMAALEKENRKAARNNAIDAALNARRITRHEAKTLRDKKLAFVEQFLAMRPKAIIASEPEQLLEGGSIDMSNAGPIPKAVQEQIDAAIASAQRNGIKLDAETLKKKYAERNGSSNGKVI